MENQTEHPKPGSPLQGFIQNDIVIDNAIKVHPDKDKIYDRDYILHFNRGSKSDFKFFHFQGTFPEALSRAKKHCTIMGLRFLYITPVVTDLEEQENKYLNSNERI